MQNKQIYEVFFVVLSNFSYLPLIPPFQIQLIISSSAGIEVAVCRECGLLLAT